MKTYEDLLEVGEDEVKRQDFVYAVISDHKSSKVYQEAKIAYDYYCKKNTTITEYRKLLYTISGEVVPDNFSANFKLTNAFYPIFVKQEVSHLLGNGVTFNDASTKDRLGGDEFDIQLVKAAKASSWGATSFGFLNLDHVDVFDILEFAPLWGEEDGGLHAGVRFWQIDKTKPLRATLYEQDGYTEYMWKDGKCEVLKPKSKYINIVNISAADGSEIIDGRNYDGFPIVPLWNNEEHQSSFIGLREKIDGYDLIQSGFANDLDDASQIYWTITNAGGMDDVDLVKFIDRMKTVKAAVVDDSGSEAEAHTIEVPYNARQTLLADLRDSLYRDAMALDTDKISAGGITATAIEAAYENLTLKCDDFETNITTFIKGLLELLGIDDSPTYKRSKIINMAEDTQMVLSAAQYLDNETILKHLPFLNPDEIEKILNNLTKEESERYEQMENELAEIRERLNEGGQGENMDGQEAVEDGRGIN